MRRGTITHNSNSCLVLSYLIHMGLDPNGTDSSLNSILHYACAYGWLQCAQVRHFSSFIQFFPHQISTWGQFLVKHGAKPDAPNLWKLTPMGVTMLKGHFAIAEYLFSLEGVDVNVRNEDVRRSSD